MGDFKMPDLGSLMEAARRMQREVQRVQEELSTRTVEASAGGGMVTVTANGRMEIVSVKIDPQVVDPSDIGMLQDLVIAATNQALVKAREMAQAEMARIAGGLAAPGMPQLF